MPRTNQTTHRLLVSGYTDGPDQAGIHLFEISSDGSHVLPCGQTGGIASPSFSILSNELLYLASETSDKGGLASCSLNEEGLPIPTSELTFKDAAGTCFALTHPSAKRLYGADYDSGSICSCALAENGLLHGPVTLIQHEGHGAPRRKDDPNFSRQLGPHVHTLSFIPNTTLLTAVDLGLDLIVIYETDSEGDVIDAPSSPAINMWPARLATLASSTATSQRFYRPQASSVETAYFESNEIGRHAHAHCFIERSYPAGEGSAIAQLPHRPAAIVEAPLFAGPRIIAYHPSGKFAALICELSCEVIIFKLDDGGLIWNPLHRWDLLSWATESTPHDKPPLAAHCAFSADGRFLYTSVRGTDQLIAFALDKQCDLDTSCNNKGVFVCSSYGATPRHFALSADESLLTVANQTSNEVSLFIRDGDSGKLQAAGIIPCPAPSCILWL